MMNRMHTQEEVPPTSSFGSLDPLKYHRDGSPPVLQPKLSNEKKHAGSIRPYRPKKTGSNTPSPLWKRDDDSRSRIDSRSLSKADCNSKKQFNSCRPSKKRSSDKDELQKELMWVKTEFKALRKAHHLLKRQKEQIFLDCQKKDEQMRIIVLDNSKLKKQADKMRNQIQFSEHELERIKKQCFKLLQIENFKNTKLQETLQEKELMIQFLRGQLNKQNCQVVGNLSRNIFLQSTTPIFRSSEGDQRPAESVKQTNQSVMSLESIFGCGPTENDKSRFMFSSISEHERARNQSQISQDSLSFSKDNNPKSLYQNIESVVISPSKVKQRQRSDGSLPSCCTFQLKEQDKKAEDRKFTRRRLQINTDDPDLSGPYQNVYCQNAPSIETKKRSQTKRHRRLKEDEKDVSVQSVEKRMKKIDVCLPSGKVKKSRNLNNTSCR